MKEITEKLLHLDCSSKVEKKGKLSYLSWSFAWGEILKHSPTATYEIKKFENNLPYVYDPNTGYMVFTSVTIDNLTHEMWLFVMDGANKAMKSEPYTYTTKYGEKSVESATMFDVNKTIMRCLTKNLAMFGLGLYIYAGEDLPEEIPVDTTKEQKQLKDCKDVESLGNIFKSLPKNKQVLLAKLATDLKLELSK